MGKKQDWYARYPAAYKVDTGRLNLMEDGAYTRLLDQYYHDGELSADAQHLFNICLTRDEQEEAAVTKVAGLFFKQEEKFEEDGESRGWFLIQKRVEEELAKVQALRKKKSDAGKEGMRVRGLTQKGNSTPDKHLLAPAQQSPTNTIQNSTGQPAGSGEPRPADAGHPGPSLQNAVKSPTTVETIDSTIPEKAESSKELKKTAREILAYLNRATGKKFQDVDSNLDPIIARMKEGATPVQIKSVIFERTQYWGTDEKMAEFLRPDTLFRRSKFWNYLGNITALDTGSQAGVESTSNVLPAEAGEKGPGKPEREPGEDFDDDIPF